MIRIYYDNNTGEITTSVTQSYADNSGNYIDIDQAINIDHWRVNLSKLTLEEIPEDQRPRLSNERVM